MKKLTTSRLAKAFAVAALPFLGGCVTTGSSLDKFMRIGSTKPEDRVRVPYNSDWHSIGYLTNSFSGGSCTATLVAPNVALTAAHCITNKRGVAAPPNRITFNVVAGAPNATDRVTDYARVTAIRYPHLSSSRTHAMSRDIAFLILDKPLGNTYGYEQIARRAPRAKSDGSVAVQQLGFTPKYGYMRLSGDFQCNYATSTTLPGVLNMDCNVFKGDSGGPVFAPANNSRGRVIVGVNSAAYLQHVTRNSYAASVIGMRPPTR